MTPEDFEQEQAYKNEVKDVVLPKWLTDEFHEHLPHLSVSYDEDMFWVSTGSTAASFPTIVEAYDYANQLGDDFQTVLDPSVDGHGGELLNLGFFCDTDKETGRSRLLSTVTTEDLENSLKHEYISFLNETTVAYNANPEDFVTAHTWLSHHPIFWHKGKKEKSYFWATDTGLSDMSLNVWANEETGKPVIFLEHGEHHEKGYTHFYHNYSIFVKEETFEKAVITMAKKVNAVFDLSGYERNPEETETGE